MAKHLLELRLQDENYHYNHYYASQLPPQSALQVTALSFLPDIVRCSHRKSHFQFNTEMLSRCKQTLKVAFIFQLILLDANLLQICWWWNKQTNGVNSQRWNHPTCFFFLHGFPFAVKAVKQAALQIGRSFHWPLLSSVTAVDSPIMTVCQDVFLLHKTPSCQRWLEHTYLLKTTLNAALTCHYRGLWEYEFPVTEGNGLDRRSMAASNRNMGSKIDWKNHSNTRGWPWSAASPFKAKSILLSAFLYPPFAPLLLCFSVHSGEQRVRGTFPGAASFTAHGPKGSRAKHKGSGHCHSPQSPTILKATFQSKMPPPRLIQPHPLRTGTGQSGPPWDTSSGRSHVSTSATHRMWNMRGGQGGLVQPERGIGSQKSLRCLVQKNAIYLMNA